MAEAEFVHATRMMNGVSATLERRILVWLAERMPPWTTADHLTAVGFVGMAGAGACFWLARSHHAALAGVVVCLAVNWFGDSLDGTIARVRHHERPRYGFYVDHVLDMVGTCVLLGGLALSGFMSPLVALGLLVAYLMLTTEVYLATYCLATFRLSFFRVGPTELRLLLVAGTIALAVDPDVSVLGDRYRLFDAGAVAGTIGMAVALVGSAVRHTLDLRRAEPLPRRPGSSAR